MGTHQGGRQGGFNQNMGGNYGQQQHNYQPMPNPTMPPPVVPNNMMAQQQPQSNVENRFLQSTMKIVASVKVENPLMKTQVGNAIFDFVTALKG